MNNNDNSSKKPTSIPEWPLIPRPNIIGMVWYDNGFNEVEIEKINNIFSESELIDGKISNGVDDVVSTSFRDSKVNFIDSTDPLNGWLFNKISEIVMQANINFYNFDISHIDLLQYTTYNQGQFYKAHADTSNCPYDNFRKLSFSLQLSDPNEYEGGDLIVYHSSLEGTIAKKNKGTIIFFPSFMLHEVTQVTRGVRKSLVGWVAGPRWK